MCYINIAMTDRKERRLDVKMISRIRDRLTNDFSLMCVLDPVPL